MSQWGFSGVVFSIVSPPRATVIYFCGLGPILQSYIPLRIINSNLPGDSVSAIFVLHSIVRELLRSLHMLLSFLHAGVHVDFLSKLYIYFSSRCVPSR